jgi:hypothetical protein
LGGGHCLGGRRRHGREVRVAGRLARRQILCVRRRRRIGVVLAGAGQVAPSIDRMTGAERQQRNQSKEPDSAARASRKTGSSDRHRPRPCQLAARRRAGGKFPRRGANGCAGVLDRLAAVTTFESRADGERR